MRVLVFEYLSAGGAVVGGEADQDLLVQGIAMRDAMTRDLLRVPGVQVVCVGPAELPVPHGAQRMTPGPAEGPFDVLRRLASGCDAVWGVSPETDGLLQLTQLMVGSDRWMGCDADAIRIAGSKRETLERLTAAGLITPREFADEARQWVVKPDDGAGACDTRRHGSEIAARADLHMRLERSRSATIEPWVDGEPLSLSLLCADGHAEMVACNRQLIAVDGGGHVAFDGVELQALAADDARLPVLRDLAEHIALAIPGLHGFVGVDLVWHATEGAVPIDINPRVTSAYVGLSERLGRNLAAEILSLHRSGRRVAA